MEPANKGQSYMELHYNQVAIMYIMLCLLLLIEVMTITQRIVALDTQYNPLRPLPSYQTS